MVPGVSVKKNISRYESHKRNADHHNTLIAVVCTQLSLANGRVTYNHSTGFRVLFLEGTMATFTCNDGYALSGAESSICQPSETWSEPNPSCGNNINILFLI